MGRGGGGLSSDGLLGEGGGGTSGGAASLAALLGNVVLTTLALAALAVTAVGVVAVVVVSVVITGGDDGDSGEFSETHRDEQVLGLSIDGDLLSEVLQDRVVGDDVLAALALLLLKLEGDSTNGALRDTLHQVRRETGNLVAQTLRRDLSNLRHDLLVGGEIHSQLSVVLLDDNASGLLDRLRTNATLHSTQNTSTRQLPSLSHPFISHGAPTKA